MSTSSYTTPRGILNILGVMQCLIALVMLGTALGTRGWLTRIGYNYPSPPGGDMRIGLPTSATNRSTLRPLEGLLKIGPFTTSVTSPTLSPLEGFLQIGLFTTSVDGVIWKTKDVLSDYDSIRSTIILESVGGFFLLVATACLLYIIFVKDSINCALAFCCSAFVAGAILIAGPVVIEMNFTDVDRFEIGFGWWFALFAGIFSFGSVATSLEGVL